jgi:hypothetical protein
MNTRTKLAIAAGAAIWMVPNLKAFAGIDITAGDWKVDFAGNVNAFYVGASCDNGTNTTVTGGLACTGDHSAAVRNGLLPAALVFNATTRQSDFDIDVTVGFYPGRRQRRRSAFCVGDTRHRRTPSLFHLRRCQLGYGEIGT